MKGIVTSTGLSVGMASSDVHVRVCDGKNNCVYAEICALLPLHTRVLLTLCAWRSHARVYSVVWCTLSYCNLIFIILVLIKTRLDSSSWPLGWLKVWSNPNLVFLAGEMCPFPPQMMTLKSGDDQIKFTHDRHPTPFPIVKHWAAIRPESFLCIFYGI